VTRVAPVWTLFGGTFPPRCVPHVLGLGNSPPLAGGDTGPRGAGGDTGRGATVQFASLCWVGPARGAREGSRLCE
jgi:hypothetical protein